MWAWSSLFQSLITACISSISCVHDAITDVWQPSYLREYNLAQLLGLFLMCMVFLEHINCLSRLPVSLCLEYHLSCGRCICWPGKSWEALTFSKFPCFGGWNPTSSLSSLYIFCRLGGTFKDVRLFDSMKSRRGQNCVLLNNASKGCISWHNPAIYQDIAMYDNLKIKSTTDLRIFWRACLVLLT